MLQNIIEQLEKYVDGKDDNIGKVEISVLQLRRIIKALREENRGCLDCGRKMTNGGE